MKKKYFILPLLFSFLLLAGPAKAQNASLFLSPANGVYSIGDTFPIQVMVDSGGEPINAAEATLEFHPGHLEVINISDNRSIFSFWSTGPDFDNARGIIEFAGGNSKSFIGSSGNLITITFRALSNASTQLTFSSGAVLAADGKGTNVLGSMTGATYDLEPAVTIPPSKKGEDFLAIPTGAPSSPAVFSSTHPSEDEWYSNNRVEITWEAPPGITGIRMSLDKNPTSLPGEEYNASAREREFMEVEDGAWYFHIRFQNNYGWGEVTHRRVLIDTQPPQSFDISANNQEDQTNPSPTLSFETVDVLSGINYYEVKIGNSESVIIERPEYKIPAQAPGSYAVIIKAIDKAKNSITETTELNIDPLERPVITEYPKSDEVGEALTIRGTSEYPGATIKAFIKREDQEAETEEVMTDDQGNWVFVYDKRLEEGIYQVWVELIDGRGAKSQPTPKITVIATPPLLLRVGRVAIDYLTVILTLAGLAAGLVLVIFFARYKISQWRQRLRKETKEAALSVVEAFGKLEEEIQEQIAYLDKKPGLSESEKELYQKLNQALDRSKKIIGKEIQDVKDELK